MKDSRRKISDLVPNRMPEFVRVDHPTLVSFLAAYYEWLQLDDRGGKLLSPMSLGDIIDVDSTIDSFITSFKKEYLFNFPEQLAISPDTGKPVDVKKLIKNIKAFYRSKGTEKSYEFLFRILYDVGVEFYYPKKDILRVSDAKWYEKNSLKVTTTLGQRIFDCVGRVIYQRNALGQVSASAKVVDVNVYQQGIYEVSELEIIGRNGTFIPNKNISFDAGDETLSEILVYSVVSSVSVTSGGSGYIVGDVVKFSSATNDAGIEARGVVSLVNSTGSIRKIKMDNFGINYNQSPTVSVDSLNGSGFVGVANVGPVCLSEGYYINYDGRLSTDKVLQDNHYYQDYSYVLKSEIVIDKYRESIRRLTHPAGTAMFGQILIKRCAKEEIDNTSALIRYEVPIIGHYAPYTFKTYDNLQDWFFDGLTFAGYHPEYHNQLITGGGNPGNPISNGTQFSVGGPSSYTSIPTKSVPPLAIPKYSIPNSGPAGDVLYESGFKNADPFWIIYEHPNRKIYGPTIAQIWKNQLTDTDFDWVWPEHCSHTGGSAAAGWTGDFYSETDPVDKKYTFLKYSPTSEFRKITARAFFEMPIGSPFDCRSVDAVDFVNPELIILSPLDNSRGNFDPDTYAVPISLQFKDRTNNNILPPYLRVFRFKFIVNGVDLSSDYPILASNFVGEQLQFSLYPDNINANIANEIEIIPLNEYDQPSRVVGSKKVRFIPIIE